jgi:archaemetzincin
MDSDSKQRSEPENTSLEPSDPIGGIYEHWFARGASIGQQDVASPEAPHPVSDKSETGVHGGEPYIEDLYDEAGRPVITSQTQILGVYAIATLLFAVGWLLWSVVFAPPDFNTIDAMVGLDAAPAKLPEPPTRVPPATFTHEETHVSEEANFSGDAQLLGTPKPGEWLHEFPEQGQTYRQFLVQTTNRRSDDRFVVYIVGLGALDSRLKPIMVLTAEHVEAYFGVPTRTLKPIPLPIEAYEPRLDQYDAKRVLARLKEALPDDALGVLAVTEADLTVSGVDWVFGMGSARNRVAVFSVGRYGQDYQLKADEGTVLRRSLVTSVHELGHVLSLRHCTAFRCLMNGTNTLQEADEHPLHLCPVCIKKVEYGLRIDRRHRYEMLRDFYREVGFIDEANFVDRRLNPPQTDSEYIEFVSDLGPQIIEAGSPAPVGPPPAAAPTHRFPLN